MSRLKEFKINDFLTLKLEGGKTNVYVGGELLNQWVFLSVLLYLLSC